MRNIIFGFSTILSFNLFAQQFRSGNQFFATPLYGQVTIRCQSPNTGEFKSAFFTCNEVRLEPVEFDYFVGPDQVKANKVHLSSLQENGDTVLKKVAYGETQTETRINLWIRTLLQTPLLNEGINKISYQMYDGEKLQAKGIFDVVVKRNKTLTCAKGHIFSQILTDCDSPYTACQKYFSEVRDCQ